TTEPAVAAEPTPPALTSAESDAAAAADLATGLLPTRQGFIGRLRGILGPADQTNWEDVEETLIAADVGARLAVDVVERASRRREPGGGEAAIRAELASLLVARDLAWQPRPSVEGGPAVILVVGVNGS